MTLMQITLGLVMLNIFILIYLTIIQIRNLRIIRAPFTIGLLLFILVFLIENIVALYFYTTMMEYYALGTEKITFALTFLKTIAFIVFALISRI